MTEEIQEPVSEEAQRAREAVITDYIEMNKHISPELRALLDANIVSPGAQQAVLSLVILGIQYGRALEREDFYRQMERAAEQFDTQPTKQPAAPELVATDGKPLTSGGMQIQTSEQPGFKTTDLLIVPGDQLSKLHH